MSPEANLLRLAYIDINALLVEGFDLYPSVLAVAKTLTEIRDLFGADDI